MSESQEAVAPRRRAPRWMWAVLVVSVALNLLIVGGALGAFWYHNRGKGEFSGPHRLLRHYAMTLPVERRDALLAVLRADYENVKPLRRKAREARREAIRRFSAEPLDSAAFVAANAKAIEARTALIQAQNRVFPQIAEKLTVEERRTLIRKMQRFRKWRRRFRHGRHGD